MNALFLKDLAEKTRRGLRGRIEGGKSGRRSLLRLSRRQGSNAGTITTGEREIEPARGRGRRANLSRVRRRSVSPKQIAKNG